ncbi:endo-1,3(4)-beta-glucanase [Lipomyces japonicus]|uniref:endo-1,3(4)-beta-glucanase n=1 Tax=Lipomyces japonicus TaxID=56871 RepID=UPI0034CF8CFE
MAVNIFAPIAVTAPHPRFQRRAHPLEPKSVYHMHSDDVGSNDGERNNKPAVHTNKFYSNLYLGNQDRGVFVPPYTVWWSREADRFGLAISQTSKQQRVYGPDVNQNPAQYYFNPIGIVSISFSAAEFDRNTQIRLSELDQFSINVDFVTQHQHQQQQQQGLLRVPIVLGTAFITGVYYNITPKFDSVVGFRAIQLARPPRIGMVKYVLELNDGMTWLLYAIVPDGQRFELSQASGSTLVATQPVYGVVVQVAKASTGSEAVYDDHAGMYATGATATGNVDTDTSVGTLRLAWSTADTGDAAQTHGLGNNAGQLLVFALTHHVSAFTSDTARRATGVSLDSHTKGVMYAYSINEFVMKEQVPMFLQFEPWSVLPHSAGHGISPATIKLIQQVAQNELEQDMNAQSNLNSMYFSGKALDKFSYIVYVVFAIIGDIDLARRGLDKLKAAFKVFSENRQQYPLVYDTVYKGIVSSGTFVTGNELEDFGNTYYNDHHFHYGYFIHAAAVIGYVDRELCGGTWARESQEFVNTLARDVGNPSQQDAYFPVSRSFDWFHGHSWAKGLFESGDGKDQESTSEDYHHAYGIKLWGQVIGDRSMEARGAMMLAIMRRSFNSYFLLANDNRVQDGRLLGNKVSGILFENKIDHTTYFSAEIECVQGIHMIPITPVSSYMRSPQYVNEEWHALLSNRARELTNSGWKGILYANVALFDAKLSFNFFADPGFKDEWLDGGASRTWYLAYAAAVGGDA